MFIAGCGEVFIWVFLDYLVYAIQCLMQTLVVQLGWDGCEGWHATGSYYFALLGSRTLLRIFLLGFVFTENYGSIIIPSCSGAFHHGSQIGSGS
ncbi:unnamed protein product [Sphenostylis stenocarpa]|uniref:Uncharacterized protein n=1 Tax=Sphenostylis stenocarpa TaxID=92480 RepID=A0AA86SP48_9FABA|nr:unnamed protein product [Sphenostylis stenocarpa]